MIILFFSGTLLFLVLLLMAAALHRKSKWLEAGLWTAGLLTLVGLSGILFMHLAADRAEFLYPWALLGLIFPLFILLGHTVFNPLARRIYYPLTHLKVEQDSLRVLFTQWLPICLYVLALCLMVIALARPVRLDRTILPPTEGVDIMMVLDVSASMQNRDFYPNRFIAAQQTANRFIEKRLNDRIGLVAFARVAMLQSPLTLDHDALQEYISALYLGIVDPNLTAIGDALGVAANHLKDSKAKSKVIILLTDGDSNAGTIEPLMAAKAAAAYNIRIYTIGTASTPGDTPYSNREDEINEGLLMEIAQSTGGKFYRAKNETELEQIYDTINKLEKTEFAPSSSINRTDFYAPLLFAALACLLLAVILEKVFLIKVP